MFGSSDYRPNRNRGRSNFGGRGRGSSNWGSRDDRRPPYVRDNQEQSRGRNDDRGFGGGGYNGGGRGGSRWSDNNSSRRGGGSSGRYRGNDWNQDDRGHGGGRRGQYDDRYGRGGRHDGSRGRGDGYYRSNGRGGGKSRTGGWGGDYQSGRGRGRDYRDRDNRDGGRWQKNRPRQEESTSSSNMPAGLEWIVNIKGHGKSITSIAFDENSGKMFTASEDSTVSVWSAESGQCEETVRFEGEVKVLLLAGGYLFVGVHKFNVAPGGMSGDVHFYNLAKNTENTLNAHVGPVVCLHAVKNLLFSGGEDKTIKAWKFNEATDSFDPAGSLGLEQGGHSHSVQCLTSISNFLFSADRTGNIRVWNLDTGSLAQKLDRAHHRSIMSMVCWQDFLITGSMDGCVCVWKYDSGGSGGSILEEQPNYIHQGKINNGVAVGILSMCGTPDAEGNPVLMVGMASREVILYNLPGFEVKGVLPEIDDARALAFAPGGYVFIGDMHGEIKVFSWGGISQDDAAVGPSDAIMEA
ncbi:hypothetical protein BSKO_00804 [Bryopsis sp. KO-2023]|nr:hypothetical protein BSKO_00804 [Bryopsis sp. KO-2023]